MSSDGSPTGTIAAWSIAAEYHDAIESRTASSSTASRPIRLITIGAGALPAGHPQVAAELARGLRDALLGLLGGHLGLHAHARLGQLGDGRGDGRGSHDRPSGY